MLDYLSRVLDFEEKEMTDEVEARLERLYEEMLKEGVMVILYAGGKLWGRTSKECLGAAISLMVKQYDELPDQIHLKKEPIGCLRCTRCGRV